MPLIRPAKRIHSPTTGAQLVLTCLASDHLLDMRNVSSAVIIMRYEEDGTETTLVAVLSAAIEASVTVTHTWTVPLAGATSAQAQSLGVYSFRVLATLANGNLAKIADDPVYVRVVDDGEPID